MTTAVEVPEQKEIVEEIKQTVKRPVENLEQLKETVKQSLAKIPESHLSKIEATFCDLSVEGWAKLQDFAYQLVLDGRFQQSIAEDIREFAAYHDIDLPVEVLKWADTVDDKEFLETMQNIARGRIEYISTSCPARADFGISVGVIVVGDAVITIVALVYERSEPVVTDLSENADEKL